MTHPHEMIGAYADGELPPEEARRLEEHLRGCTECARELALIHTMGGAMRTAMHDSPSRGVWDAVHRRITRPIGWILFVAGVVTVGALAAVEWFRAGALTAEWLGTTAIAVGLALLLVGVGYEQYREWRNSPYKDIER